MSTLRDRFEGAAWWAGDHARALTVLAVVAVVAVAVLVVPRLTAGDPAAVPGPPATTTTAGPDVVPAVHDDADAAAETFLAALGEAFPMPGSVPVADLLAVAEQSQVGLAVLDGDGDGLDDDQQAEVTSPAGRVCVDLTERAIGGECPRPAPDTPRPDPAFGDEVPPSIADPSEGAPTAP